jgi:regulation of enolase protein 1 (concanavalin A-like superfamily)
VIAGADDGATAAAQACVVPGLPRPLRWLVRAPSFEVTGAGALRLEAGPRSDWFIDPGRDAAVRNAPALVMPAKSPWQLSAVVSADHRATFDAGVLFVHVDVETWAKLCLELSPQGKVMVVSVVTRGTSDDCNSMPVEGHSLHLRVSALARAFAFHWSPDGRAWHLLRYFSLGDSAPSAAGVGFMAQSPTGEGCTAEFTDVTFRPQLLAELRAGD